MDNSINSMSEALSEEPKIASLDDPQESGWTIYFEEFLSKSKEKHSSSKNDMGSSSLVSDATSSAAKKLTGKALATNFSLGESWLHLAQQRFCSEKRKAGGAWVEEDAFSDTASSPVRSPKVKYETNQLNQLHKCRITEKVAEFFTLGCDVSQLKKECLHHPEGKWEKAETNGKRANGLVQRQRQ